MYKEDSPEEIERQNREFAASLKRSVKERLKRRELRTFKPVMDEGPGVRVFDTMEDYRQWCEANLPFWMGYHRVSDEQWDAMVREAMEN